MLNTDSLYGYRDRSSSSSPRRAHSLGSGSRRTRGESADGTKVGHHVTKRSASTTCISATHAYVSAAYSYAYRRFAHVHTRQPSRRRSFAPSSAPDAPLRRAPSPKAPLRRTPSPEAPLRRAPSPEPLEAADSSLTTSRLREDAPQASPTSLSDESSERQSSRQPKRVRTPTPPLTTQSMFEDDSNTDSGTLSPSYYRSRFEIPAMEKTAVLAFEPTALHEKRTVWCRSIRCVCTVHTFVQCKATSPPTRLHTSWRGPMRVVSGSNSRKLSRKRNITSLT
jgi:hypothetical protein